MKDAVHVRVNRIAAKLQAAAEGGFQPFGAQGHDFRLAPPLTESQLTAFERRHAVELPSEYREFVIEVGDGGAGPAYGMYSLEESLSKELRRSAPPDYLRTPFPHVNAYNPYKDLEVNAFWQAVESGEISEAEGERRSIYQTAGTLALCHEGCGYLHFLVVTGPARGQMWLDGRGSDQGFFPLGVSFLDWYERWLDSTLAGGDGVWWMTRPTESGTAADSGA
jgi:SMI1 / KNR4 family (SUKH-1)